MSNRELTHTPRCAEPDGSASVTVETTHASGILGMAVILSALQSYAVVLSPEEAKCLLSAAKVKTGSPPPPVPSSLVPYHRLQTEARSLKRTLAPLWGAKAVGSLCCGVDRLIRIALPRPLLLADLTRPAQVIGNLLHQVRGVFRTGPLPNGRLAIWMDEAAWHAADKALAAIEQQFSQLHQALAEHGVVDHPMLGSPEVEHLGLYRQQVQVVVVVAETLRCLLGNAVQPLETSPAVGAEGNVLNRADDPAALTP